MFILFNQWDGLDMCGAVCVFIQRSCFPVLESIPLNPEPFPGTFWHHEVQDSFISVKNR